ncbi:MAG: D-alanyl-D-alanine carboxypeptidase [Clostridia bacterium]|nr:D-alanyl-D-alanine carboxypeptidase [Clostridia bacterium]
MRRSLRFIISLFLITVLLFGAVPRAALAEPEETGGTQTQETETQTQETGTLPVFDPASIEAYYAILYDMDTGFVLAEKNADGRMYPASTTKTMTCLVALENAADRLDEPVTAGEEVKLITWDSSSIDLVPGEVMTLRDLLYGLMLSSGNDAANTIAVAVGGSIEGFVDMMNAKAEELEMTGTHYVNAHGLSDENHYTTARDMMKLVQYAEQNETFREITGSLTHTVAPSETRPEGVTFINSNLLLHEELPDKYFSGAFGVKTGFTNAAGYCLLAAAEKDGVRLGACIYLSTEEGRYKDAHTILDYGFSCYDTVDLRSLLADRLPVTMSVQNASSSDLMRGMLLLEQVPDGDGMTVPMLKTDAAVLRSRATEIEFMTDPILLSIEAPVSEGEEVGRYRYTLDGNVLLEGTLVSTRPVEKMEPVVPWQENTNGTRVGNWRFMFYPVAATLVIVGIMLLVQGAFLRQYRRNRRNAAAKNA